MKYLLARPNIRRITPSDYRTIDAWYDKRNRDMPDPKTFSDMGYMADGRVAGWLYVTNSNMAMIEGIIADPDTVPSLRKASLEKLCGFLVDTAVALGYTHIFGITEHPSIEKVCYKLGFQEAKGFRVFVLNEPEDG